MGFVENSSVEYIGLVRIFVLFEDIHVVLVHIPLALKMLYKEGFVKRRLVMIKAYHLGI